MLRICVLGSGSSGNCALVCSGRAKALVDAGLSLKEIGLRMESIGEKLSEVNAVCVTHEHEDHVSALGVLHRRLGAPLYANAGAIEAIERSGKHRGLPWNVFATGYSFEIGDMKVEPFSVPHDSYDPVGFIFSSGGSKVGIVTDMGTPTDLIRARSRGCQVLVIESNHDEQMLRDAARPWPLKQRIAGRQGHLSNAQAARLIEDVASPELRAIFLAHMSSECNRHELALSSAEAALRNAGFPGVAVKLTYPDKPSEVVCC